MNLSLNEMWEALEDSGYVLKQEEGNSWNIYGPDRGAAVLRKWSDRTYEETIRQAYNWIFP